MFPELLKMLSSWPTQNHFIAHQLSWHVLPMFQEWAIFFEFRIVDVILVTYHRLKDCDALDIIMETQLKLCLVYMLAFEVLEDLLVSILLCSKWYILQEVAAVFFIICFVHISCTMSENEFHRSLYESWANKS